MFVFIVLSQNLGLGLLVLSKMITTRIVYKKGFKTITTSKLGTKGPFFYQEYKANLVRDSGVQGEP